MRALIATLTLLALAAALIAGAPRPAAAAPATVTLAPAGDTYVYADQSAAGRSFGAAPALAIGYDEFSQEQYALLNFDLAGVPAGAPIESAKLGLYLIDAPQALDVRVERVDAAWDAADVSWNSRPPTTPAEISRLVGPGKGFYIEWEIGPLVAEWRALRRPRPSFGLALRGPASYNLGMALASGESATPPRLVVAYTPVIAIDLRVALEWEPGGADTLGAELAPGCPGPGAGMPAGYRANLERGLRETARYLYSMSEGQITLGEVTIGSDTKAWQEADVRVLASSGYRPSAYVGGIVDAPRLGATPGGQPVLHYPAPVFLGRLWDGAGARCGGWAEPEGWRTMGHELAHFALFLYDQYTNVRDGQAQYCASADLAFLDPGLGRAPAARAGRAATLMAYQYSADKLWLGAPPPSGAGPRRLGCADTPHDSVYPDHSEWDVLSHFYPALRTPSVATLRTDWDSVFEAEIVPRGILRVGWAAPATRADSTAAVRLDALRAAGLVGEAYLVREGAPGVPQRIIGQGWRIPGEAAPPAFLGATPGAPERAAIFVADGASGERYAVPPALPAGGLSLADGTVNRVAARPSEWRPTLVLTPTVAGDGSRFSEVTALNLQLTDCAMKTEQIELTYCPAGGNCDNPVRVSRDADGSFRHRFGPYPLDGRGEPPALYGYLHARSTNTGEEFISWYQIGGGVGPAHIDGHAPLIDGAAAVEAAPGGVASGRDNRVLLAPSPVCAAAKLPAGVAGLIGAPLGVQVTLASNPQLDQPERGWGGPDAPLRVRLSYDQALLDALGIDEGRLVPLRLAPDAAAWELAGEEGRSADLDWVAAAARDFGGDGEIYALGYRAPQLFLPALWR